MLAGFEELMNKVDSTIPQLTNTLNRRGEEIDKMIEEFPVLGTQQRELAKRLDACTNEQEIQRKKQRDIGNVLSTLLHELNDVEDQYMT